MIRGDRIWLDQISTSYGTQPFGKPKNINDAKSSEGLFSFADNEVVSHVNEADNADSASAIISITW